jgi:hypothetical protein
MAKSKIGPRKQRTRQHVIADLSVHHVEGFILEEGHTAQRLGSDYGYDLMMNTFDPAGYAEPWPVYFQLKAMEALRLAGTVYVFDLDIRDYNLWIREEILVVLVLFDARRRRAFWICVQKYFGENPVGQRKKGTKTIRVRIPKQNVFNRLAVNTIREMKSDKRRPSFGVLS